MGPDFAESWEISPDGLQITMKLRANAKWHNKAPVNGRAADSSDVLFSWNRYTTNAPLRGLVSNSANPQAPVLSMAATDARTVVIAWSPCFRPAPRPQQLHGSIVITPRRPKAVLTCVAT
jgi:ABC-type transport system substrate-binding protein